MSCQQHSAKIWFRLSTLVSTAIALPTFLCTQRTFAQVTVGNVNIAPDITQPEPLNCVKYSTVLYEEGVSVNGQGHSGRCRLTVFTPLFDGLELGTNMQAFLHSPAHPPLFQIRRTREKALYCATSSKLKVALRFASGDAASVDVARRFNDRSQVRG
jgi:hypothetical protein